MIELNMIQWKVQVFIMKAQPDLYMDAGLNTESSIFYSN